MEPTRPGRDRGTSPWAYLGCGCAGLVFLALAAVAVMTWVAYREGKEFERAWSDPAVREAKTREVVGWDELPEGYHPLGSFSIPFLMDMALFSDQPPAEGAAPDEQRPMGGFEERGFLYMKFRRFGKSGDELRAYLQGKGAKPEWLDAGTDVDPAETIRRGTVEVNGLPVLYSASRGKVTQEGSTQEGITTMLAIDCPQDDLLRFGVWFGPDPAPDRPVAEVDFTGTPADPEEIREFASHFRFCPDAEGAQSSS